MGEEMLTDDQKEHNSQPPVAEEQLTSEEQPVEGLAGGEQPAEVTLEEDLQAKISELERKASEYLDGWQRARAEFANYKKRVEREQAQMYQLASGAVLKKFLDVVDDLERALKNCPPEIGGTEWVQGIELIYRKLLGILEAEGVTKMEAEGQQFDPTLHEAISHEEVEGYVDGQIIEVVKQGFLLGDRVLRPAMVRVARQAASPNAT
ncbi:MAG: nucleotide exchange factor GrpE [Anaerolineales bacterium]|nr:nucleotide exchange factor GrpE [Anaerolineales bacterium]MCS7248313.1 nucleotide exchange factor GrpE [Anaerolineales bacterium]MDW8162126.1 nucleotide exchange factor GrpE [Anaerolineales bacterium]MDW8447661.1 nucleotide exchange factor GrpE [Anaerolineales bacterium]